MNFIILQSLMLLAHGLNGAIGLNVLFYFPVREEELERGELDYKEWKTITLFNIGQGHALTHHHKDMEPHVKVIA